MPQGHEAEHSSESNAKLKNGEVYLHSHMRLTGVVLIN
jgi:hypothetical protein